jgi:nucleoside-diphosphate-sugar epimerase
MKLLVIGGTLFLGRHMVEAALAAGHEVTLFNRGRTNPHLFPGVERLVGDRSEDLSALAARSFDGVVDTCGYVPRVTRASAEALADHVGRYVFVSTIGVYEHPMAPGADETTPVIRMDDWATETVDGETYGPLKALCEESVEAVMPGRAIHVRAGLIVGPHDVSDRFTYWPVRIARGGDVVVPDAPDLLVQFIDVRDLAQWMLTAIVDERSGPYHVTGPAQPLTFRRFLEACREVSGSDAVLRRASPELLESQKVSPWMDLPLWLTGDHVGMSQASIARAVSHGLEFRPLADTIRDTLEWAQTRPADHAWRAGLSPKREAAVLAAL